MTYVFDTSAPIRFLDAEPGGQQVGELLIAAVLGKCKIEICAVNWGEIVYAIGKRYDTAMAERVEVRLLSYPIQIIPADAVRAAQAGRLKLKYKIGYADAFGVELALTSPDHILVTADYGVKPAAADVRIEFLPTKPKP